MCVGSSPDVVKPVYMTVRHRREGAEVHRIVLSECSPEVERRAVQRRAVSRAEE